MRHDAINRFRRCDRRAFTLVEILMVVVILGILAAIAMPQFNEVRDDATEGTIRKDLQTVRTQLELYRFTNNGHPPDLNDLVIDGYLPELPTHPAGGNYVYTSADGSYTSSYDASW